MIGKRLIVVVLLAAGILGAWRWRDLFDPLALTGLIGGNPLAPLAFLAMHIAGSLCFVPRTLLALGAGLVFGMWWGVLWAALGSLAGAVAGFLAARDRGSGFLDRVGRAGSAGPAALLDGAGRGGWRMVGVMRVVPITPHSLAIYALGLTGVGLGAYAVGSLLGIGAEPH